MSKTCDRCGKELTDRDRTTICLECEVALVDEINNQLETDNKILKHNTDAIWDIYQSSKRENAALREKLAAEKKRADAAIEDIKRMDRYIAKSDDPYAALCEVCKYKPQHGGKCKRCDVHDNAGFEWRGDQEGEHDV